VLLSVVFGRFLCVLGRMESMSCGDFRMVRGLLMSASFVMLRSLQMVFCCELVMFSRFFVVLSTFVSCHLVCSSHRDPFGLTATLSIYQLPVDGFAAELTAKEL
jgi:hypothetical protein